jgi:hypothetical protein
MLVQVYDGGNMPTGPDKVYLTHPAKVVMAIEEGAELTISADESRSIPVVFVRGTPQVGDVVTAHNQGGVWLAEVGGCPFTIQVRDNLVMPIADARVRVYDSGGTLRFDGLTDSSGDVAPTLAGGSTVRIVIGDVARCAEKDTGVSVEVACGGTAFYRIGVGDNPNVIHADADHAVKAGVRYPLKRVLNYTDSTGPSGTMTYDGAGMWVSAPAFKDLVDPVGCLQKTGRVVVYRAPFNTPEFHVAWYKASAGTNCPSGVVNAFGPANVSEWEVSTLTSWTPDGGVFTATRGFTNPLTAGFTLNTIYVNETPLVTWTE